MLGTLDDEGQDFDNFYRTEFGRMLALAYALTGDRAAAEDLAQDAFVSANRQWGRIGRYDSPAGFVRRAIINRSRSRFRKRGRESAALARVVAEPRLAGNSDGFVETETFWRAVRALPQQQARCVVLRYVEDLDTASIAAVLGCAEPTVRVHLHRARLTVAVTLGLEAD